MCVCLCEAASLHTQQNIGLDAPCCNKAYTGRGKQPDQNQNPGVGLRPQGTKTGKGRGCTLPPHRAVRRETLRGACRSQPACWNGGEGAIWTVMTASPGSTRGDGEPMKPAATPRREGGGGARRCRSHPQGHGQTPQKGQGFLPALSTEILF